MKTHLLALLFATPLAAQQPVASEPRLLNETELSDLLRRSYPPELRMNSIAGINQVRVFVTTEGKPDSIYLRITSGSPRLDDAAITLASKMKFAPAMQAGAAVGAWLDVPFSFVPEYTAPDERRLPRVLNRVQADSVLLARYARARKNTTDAFSVGMAVQVDENGVPRSISLYNPSCMNQLDDIARTVARTMRFEPIAGRINVAMYFDRDTAYSRVTGDTIAHAPPKRGGVFSAFSKGQAPELRNRDYVGRRLLALYPAHLRSSGVSGEVLLWVLVNEKGAAEKTRVKESSGRCELDLAALRVASSMMFSPARKDDVPTKVWIQIPIVFRSML